MSYFDKRGSSEISITAISNPSANRARPPLLASRTRDASGRRGISARSAAALLAASAAILVLPVAAARAATTGGTFGKTTVGATCGPLRSDYKRVNEYALNTNATVSSMSVWLKPGSGNGSQAFKGIIYADSGGSPGALVGATNGRTFSSTDSAGWYTLNFASPPTITAGHYWLGMFTGTTVNVAAYCYDTGASNARDANNNTYTSGPSNPFGPVTTQDSQLMPVYASYTVAGLIPVNTGLPVISDTTPAQNEALTTTNGTWTNTPTSYSYQWEQCDSSGANCTNIGSKSSGYTVASADVGHTLRVVVTATNASGSAPATSVATSVVTAATGGTRILNLDFENGNTTGYFKAIDTEGACTAGTSSVVTAASPGVPTGFTPRTGTYAFKVVVPPATNGSGVCRYQLVPNTPQWTVGTSFYVGVSIWLDTNWNLAQLTNNGSYFTNGLFSFRNTSDSKNGPGANLDTNEVSGVPTYETYINLTGTVADNTCHVGRADCQMMGTVTKGHWEDWVEYVKWASDSTGHYTIWRNGVQVDNYSGVTQEFSYENMEARLGIYEGSLINQTRTTYYDNYRIATTYSAADPSQP